MKTHLGVAFPDADVFMAQEIRADGSYQKDHLDAALAYVTTWSLAVDAGAHVGTWSRLLSPRFKRVIAVEPSVDTFEALQANVLAFALVNVDALNLALGATPGLVTMTLDARATAMQNTGARYVTTGGSIPCERLDDWGLPSLGFLKLDVEGSEPLILDGAAQTIQRCQPIVLFEDKKLWKRFGLLGDAPQDRLRRLGYRELERVGCDAIWGPQ